MRVYDIAGVLSRFHATLVSELEDRGLPTDRPFTVAEIYQELAPYRSHRQLLGVEMNGDYEDALLRLLAGEGDYLELESETARDQIREELASPNPDTGLYREFAALDVRLLQTEVESGSELASEPPAETPAAAIHFEEEIDVEEVDVGEVDKGELVEDEAEVESAAEDEVEEVDDLPAPALDEESETHSDSEPVFAPGPADSHPSDPQPESPSPVPSEGACRWCQGDLPKRDNLRYCPRCGADVRSIPCPVCGEQIESQWRFCIACGTEVGDGVEE